MPYVIDRKHIVRMADVVAVVPVRQRGVRSRLIYRDNSLYHTRTRPSTLVRAVTQRSPGLIQLGARPSRRQTQQWGT